MANESHGGGGASMSKSKFLKNRDILLKKNNIVTSAMFGSPFPLNYRADPPIRQDGTMTDTAAGKKVSSFAVSPEYGRGYEEMITDGGTISFNPGNLMFKGDMGLFATLSSGDTLDMSEGVRSFAQELLLPSHYFAAVKNASRDIADQFLKEYKDYYKDRGQPDRVPSYKYFSNETTSKQQQDYFNTITNNMGATNKGVIIPFFTYGEVKSTAGITNEVGDSSIKQTIEGARDIGGGATLLREYMASTGNKQKSAAKQYLQKDGGLFQTAGDMTKAGMFYNPIIPKIWKNSTAESSYTVTIKLSSPYGDPDSRFKHIFVPLMYLVPLIYPKDRGPKNLGFFSAPYSVTVHVPGKFYIPMGMIASMSMIPGDINRKGEMLSMTLELNIVDLQPLMVSSDENHSAFLNRNRNRLTQTILAYGGFSMDVIAKMSFSDYVTNKGEEFMGLFNVKHHMCNLYEDTVTKVKSFIANIGVNRF